MEYVKAFGSNTPLMAAIAAWAIAQVLKVIITAIVERTVDINRLFASGGMPSSHSSFVMALTVTIGYYHGFDSVYFALSAAFALVVMYDACGVRRAVGEQAKVLNNILSALKEHSAMGDQAALKEILGHSPFQVVMGFFLGIAVGIGFIVLN